MHFSLNFNYAGTNNEQNIQKVLERLGLQECFKTFEEHGILDYKTFLTLRNDDLRELNFLFGHRIKIRNEIDRLNHIETMGKDGIITIVINNKYKCRSITEVRYIFTNLFYIKYR